MSTNQQLVPIANLGSLYINGLQVSNNATTPNTKIDVALGQARDSTNIFDIVLTAGVTINAAVNGINGLDTGTFAASKNYYVHVITDSTNNLPTGCIISLSRTAPTLPFGYSVFRVIGAMTSDSSVHFLPGYWSGNGSERLWMYDAPQATAITAGNATSYTAITLDPWVPAIDGIPVWISSAFTPGAASRTLKLQPAGGTGDAITVTGQVTSVVVSSNSYLVSKIASSVAKVSYKVANSGDAVAINVAGYQMSL